MNLTSEAIVSNMKWLKMGFVGFSHTRPRIALSSSTQTEAYGAMPSAATTETRITHFMT